MTIAVILGSSFKTLMLGEKNLTPVALEESYQNLSVYRYSGAREAYLLFRHGLKKHLLPHQIPYRQQMKLLQTLGCKTVLITGAVGLLDTQLPLYTPLCVTDILMPDNRLPDGSACTMFDSIQLDQAHLVITDGLCSSKLTAQLQRECRHRGFITPNNLVFTYTPGPRTKTSAENIYWRQLGAHVNSMTIAPEIVLANELQMSVACLVSGHKYSTSNTSAPIHPDRLKHSLECARNAMESLICWFIEQIEVPPFANTFFKF